MLAAFRSFHSSVFLRAISIGCVVVAFSYIFFEVLDLDGSNFPLQRFPVDNAAIVPEVETNIVPPYLTRWAVLWTEVLCFLLPEQVDSVCPRLIENFKASALNSIQRRNYRVALPRSSVPDHL
jgi:hypothetical protein